MYMVSKASKRNLTVDIESGWMETQHKVNISELMPMHSCDCMHTLTYNLK